MAADRTPANHGSGGRAGATTPCSQARMAACVGLAPVPAVVLLLAFPFLDLLTPSHLGTVLAHAVLLVGLGWIGLAIARPASWVPTPRAAVPAT